MRGEYTFYYFFQEFQCVPTNLSSKQVTEASQQDSSWFIFSAVILRLPDWVVYVEGNLSALMVA